MKRIWLFLVMVLCLAFAVRTLLLIDATALWSDELYSVGKSYALLVLLVALAWWWRRSSHLIGYGMVAGLAGMTHFYG